MKAYLPGLSVTLVKLVARNNAGVASRYTAAPTIIDLTPYLGDSGVVRTQKGLGEPCGGFSISFADQMEPITQDTLYAMIEPMDMILIRASREAWRWAGGDLPLIMRGFVSTVRRVESMGSDGDPRRIVVVQGQDSGKLFMNYALWWEVAVAQDQAALTNFRMQDVFNMAPAVYSLPDFVSTVVSKILNPKVAGLGAVTQRTLPPIALDVSVPASEGEVLPEMIFNYSGPIWGLIAPYAEQPWNELFIEDREDAAYLVFRPTPFHGLDGQLLKGADGKLLLPGASDPLTVPVALDEIVAMELSRSDDNIANFFWVPPGQSMLISGMALDKWALIQEQPLDFNYANNNPALYGQKRMEVPTRVQPTGIGALPATPAGAQFTQWHLKRANQLKAMNRDNGVFESGSIVLRGSEDFRPGRYIQITRGNQVSENYLMAVSHMIMPFGNWTTTVVAERGTGFLKRAATLNSPYIGEGRPGAYGVSA